MRRTPMKVLVVVSAAAVAVLVCVLWLRAEPDPADPTGGFQVDGVFNKALFEATHAGSPIPLSSVTDFEWETVSIFGEGAAAEQIVDETGLDLVDDRYYFTRVLLVFCANGSLIASEPYQYPNLSPADRLTVTYSNAAVVDGNGLVEPSGREVEAECTQR